MSLHQKIDTPISTPTYSGKVTYSYIKLGITTNSSRYRYILSQELEEGPIWLNFGLNILQSTPIGRKSVPPSHSTFKPRVRRWYYADLAFAVPSLGLGKHISRLRSYPTDDRKHSRLCLRIFRFPGSDSLGGIDCLKSRP
jgi:hypothetical protein